jgi:hypothetical protein
MTKTAMIIEMITKTPEYDRKEMITQIMKKFGVDYTVANSNLYYAEKKVSLKKKKPKVVRQVTTKFYEEPNDSFITIDNRFDNLYEDTYLENFSPSYYRKEKVFF